MLRDKGIDKLINKYIKVGINLMSISERLDEDRRYLVYTEDGSENQTRMKKRIEKYELEMFSLRKEVEIIYKEVVSTLKLGEIYLVDIVNVYADEEDYEMRDRFTCFVINDTTETTSTPIVIIGQEYTGVNDSFGKDELKYL